jgi:hypothetical protein
MQVGESFVWHEGSRWIASYGRSHTGAPQGGTVGKVMAWKPRHPHDCLTAKAEAARTAQADDIAALAIKCGATPEQAAYIRARALGA